MKKRTEKRMTRILAVILAVLILLLLYFDAFAFAADTTEDTKLYIEDKLDNTGDTTVAGIEILNMDNTTSMNMDIHLDYLHHEMITAFFHSQDDALGSHIAKLWVLTYNNGQIEIYRFDQTTSVDISSHTDYNWMSTISEHTILGPVQNGDVLHMEYNITNINSTTDTGNLILTYKLNNYTYNFELDGITATNATASGHQYTRRLLLGSVLIDDLSSSNYAISDLQYQAYKYNETLYNISENFTIYNGHYFTDGETLTKDNQTYAKVYEVSPARVYAATHADVYAPAGTEIISPDVIIEIKAWFLENAWWIIGVIFGLLIIDMWIDAHDLYQDKRRSRRRR